MATRSLVSQLRELTALPAPSGDERAVASWIADALTAHGFEPEVDAIGNVVVRRGERLSGLLTAHMDQVGFMVSRLAEARALCLPVGEPELREPCGATVVTAGRTKTRGRLEPLDETTDAAVLRAEDLDVVDVGDRVVFAGELREDGDGFLRAPALDNRIGCWILLHAAFELASARDDLAFAWTVREETEGSGAVSAARRLEPSWTISVDVTPAGEARDAESDIVAGRGPAITLLDGGMVAHPPLLDAFTRAARASAIPYQREVVAEGSSEAGVVEAALGIPGLALLVPIEAAHSPAERASPSDVAHALSLLVAGVRRL